jgi:PKD repeat protein
MDENTTPPAPQDPQEELKIEPVIEEEQEEKKELTPDEKKAKRKAMLKRLGVILGVTYVVVIAITVAWAFLAYGKEIGVFNYLPITQVGLSNFLFTLFNVMWGVLVFAALCAALFGLAKMLLSKKEDLEKKKKGKKITIFSGIGFFALVALWILALAFLGPRLVAEAKSGITTDPANTLGLTAPVEIVFDAAYIPLDSSYQIISYTWNFGDGDTANGELVSHRYTQKGSTDGRYTVTLNVDYLSPSGEQGDAEYTTEISIDNEQVAAAFTAKPDSGEIPLDVTFDASGSYDPDGEIIAYEWDLDGDGRYDDAEGVTATYTYEQEGDFEASLRVTDNNGEYNTMEMIIEAGSVNGLRAVITTDAKNNTYYLDETYEFDGSDSTVKEGEITKYTWDFDEGTTTQSRNVNHDFSEPGTYEVVLSVEDSEGNKDEATLEITVVDEGSAPTAIIEADPESGELPLTVEFDGSGSIDPDDDIIQYEWDFDSDGTIDATGDHSSYTYTEVDDYEATLTVTDSIGNENEAMVEISVGAQGIVADLEVDTTNGEVPLTVSFDSSGSSYKDGNIVSYEYDFGDGNDYIGGSTLTYKYTGVGTYTASVTVIGDDGASDTSTVQIVVRPVSLTACFTVNTDDGSAPLFLSVDPSCSEGTIESYSWDFGDGELSFDRKPETHVYETPGIYNVTLEVTSGDGIVDTFENTVTVD